MIERPNNWDQVQEFSERAKLPLGAYVCRIVQANVVQTDNGKQLAVLFDIAEGEYKNFFANDYKTSTVQNKKYKGVLRLWLPKNDGSEKDEWTKSTLKGFTTSVEVSNSGYHWNWDEQTLKNKMIGIIFRNEEWEYEGKTGWAVRPFRAARVETIRSGEYTLPNDKPLKEKEYTRAEFSDMAGGTGAGNPFTNGYQQTSVDQNYDDDEGLPF